MYKIDFITVGDNHDRMQFAYEYADLIHVLNLDVDTDIIDSHLIDEDESIYDVAMIQNGDYNSFVRELNDAIVNTQIDIVGDVDGIVYLFVNGAVRGSTKHMSDEDVDYLYASHIFDYCGDGYDYDSIDLNGMASMIRRFVDIVKMMNS